MSHGDILISVSVLVLAVVIDLSARRLAASFNRAAKQLEEVNSDLEQSAQELEGQKRDST